MKMVKEHIAKFGEFEFYKHYFIGRIYEGANAGPEFVDALSELIQKHYCGQPIIYISDRTNSYSLDPITTQILVTRNNIRFAGIVTYTEHQELNIHIEKRIINKTTMRSFSSLDSAITWAEQKSLEINQ